MEALKTLDIRFDYSFQNRNDLVRKSVDLSQLIAACPSKLTTLKTHDLDLRFSEPISHLTSIQCLRLFHVEFTPELANAIETSFPKLSTLTLAGEISTNVTISLPNHNLKSIYITAMYDKVADHNDYSIESKCNDGVQYHTIKRTPNNNNDGQLYAYDGRAKPVEQLFFYTGQKCGEYH